MLGFLRQSTASQVVSFGPLLDRTDFVTAENGLTINASDIKLKKAGGGSGNKNSGGATADGTNGLYHMTLDATDSSTVGILHGSVDVAGALPWTGFWYVLEEAVYDAMFAASAPGYVANAPVHANSIAANAINASALSPDFKVELFAGHQIATGTLGATGNTTTTLHLTGLPFGDDELNDLLLVIYDVSATEYHSRWISDWVNSTALATVETLPFTPQNNIDTYTILPVRRDVTGSGGTDWTADEKTAIKTILGVPASGTTPDEPTAGALKVIDDLLDTEVAAIKAKTDNLPTDPADASDIASAFGTVNTTLATIAGYLDTEIASIKAKTDNLPTDPADQSAVEAAITAATSGLATAAALATVDGIVDNILLDTNELQTDWADGGRLDLILDARASQISVEDLPTNAELATALAAADDAVLAAIVALNNLSAAQVKAQVVEAIATDTYAEPGQGAPAATASLAAKINYLFKAWRNKKTQTATTLSLFNDAESTVDQKAGVSDDGTTATVGEMASGP